MSLPSFRTRPGADGHSYGMVLAKEKNNEKALEYLIRSVHLFPMNWGCWLEIASLISRVEDVSSSMPPIPTQS